MKILLSLLLLVITTQSSFGQVDKVYKVSSPGRSTAFEAGINNKGQLVYRIYFDKQKVTDWALLGIMLEESKAGEKTVIKSKTKRSNKEQFSWPLGEDDVIINTYNEMVLSCSNTSIDFDLMVRVYDGSVAFRYLLPPSGMVFSSIKKECTVFQLTEPYTIYQYNHESVFTPSSIDTLSKTCDLPATLTNGNFYISIGEAANDGYTKAELRRGSVPNSLEVAYVRDSMVNIDSSVLTPWRTISIAKNAIGLHKFSQLYVKLNPPPATAVPSWIKPGKLIRSQLNTQSGIACIDFAARHHFQYILFDAGWYGHEFRSTSDPTQVIPQIDMLRVIQYGKEKGIGVILYVNYVGLRAKLDTILPLYKKWGVAGLKFGFVDGLSQKGITWLADAIRKVNDFGFVLNIHDNYKPTGLSRTYPALLTQEGIRGDENSPDAFHNTTLPFTRFLSGPADFTYCFPNPKNSFSKNIKVSKAQQLALTVVYFSPLQAIFWYGKPEDYTNEDEIEFFTYVPTTWNESHYLAGDIGKNISVARRKGDTWYVGNAAGFEDWKGSITFDFLSKWKTYIATVYEDDGQGGIGKRTLQVKKGDLFPFEIKAKGGQAIIIRPEFIRLKSSN